MAKGSGRQAQRSRKVNHKTRILVKTGFDAVGIVDEPLDHGESRYELDDLPNARFVAGTATDARGVDQGESEELHLREVLTARSRGGASASGSTSAPRNSIILNQVDGRITAAPSPTPTPPTPSTSAVIPTPSASGKVDPEVYSALYPSNVYHDPHNYLAFSDTVEQSIVGAVDYDMDEQDEEWLEAFNREVEAGKAKGKGKAKQTRSTITEDEFESVMEALEKVMDESSTVAQSSKATPIPPFESLLPALRRQPSFICRPLPDSAEWIYPHWRERRLARKGQSIIPRLDHDEDDNSPYVCFRRREVKLARKTRRSDEQNLSRLIRVRDDLYAALELMKKIDRREKLRLEEATLDKQIFEGQVAVREMKRKLGEDIGDESLLLIHERKRHRIVLGESDPTTRTSPAFRHPPIPHASSLPLVGVEERQRRKDNLAIISKRVEQDEQQKQIADKGWEDSTSGAYHPLHLPLRDRCWTAVEPREDAPMIRNEATGEWSTPLAPSRSGIGGGWRGPVFRKRVGRGGRIMLDRAGLSGREGARIKSRTAAEDEQEEEMTKPDREEAKRAWQRRIERFRYDDDLALSSLPTRDEPQIIDDFAPAYVLRRVTLLGWEDYKKLEPDPAYVKGAEKYLDDLKLAVQKEKPPEIVYRPATPRQSSSPDSRPGPSPSPARQPSSSSSPRGASPSTDAQKAAQLARRVSLGHSQLAKERERERQIQQAQAQVQDRFTALNRFVANSTGPTIAKPPMFPSAPVKLPLQPTNSARHRAPVVAASLPQAWQAASATSQGPPSSATHHHPVHVALPTRPLPLGANQLRATSNLAAPPYSNPAPLNSPIRPAAQLQQQQPRAAPFSAFPAPTTSAGAFSATTQSMTSSSNGLLAGNNYALSPQIEMQSLLAQTPRRSISVGSLSPAPSSSGSGSSSGVSNKKRRISGVGQG